MLKPTPLPMYLPHNVWLENELSKHIPLEELHTAIHRRDVPLKDVPGYDYRQIDRLDLERRWPIVKQLCFESEIDVTPKFLNGPVHQLIGVVRIERQQPSLDPRDPLAGYQPDLVVAVKNRLNAGHRPGAGGNEQWERFCDEVRKDCGKEKADRGYSDKTIKRIVAN